MKGSTKLILVATFTLALTGCATNDGLDNTTTRTGVTGTSVNTGTGADTNVTGGIGTTVTGTNGLGAGDVTIGTTSRGIVGDVAETVGSAITGTTTAR